jgi:hypothetical protein
VANFDRPWDAFQSNTSEPIHFHTRQFSQVVVGSARFNGNSGDVDGQVRGNLVNFVVNWHNGTKGEYHGSIGFNGRVTGNTFDQMNPTSQALWHSAQSDFTP